MVNFVFLGQRLVGTTYAADLNELPEVLRDEYHLVSEKEFFQGCTTDEEKITKMFQFAGLYYDNYGDSESFVVEIEWGDWKHDHSFCDDLMAVMGYTLEDEVVTEEDGSDCYSSRHIYRKAA